MTAAAAAVRGTPEWQAEHLDAQRAVNVRAQAGLELGAALDMSNRPAPGGQLDLFADAR